MEISHHFLCHNHNKDIGKVLLEDIDLDSGTVPTYSPEITIEPIIIPQTAHILYEDNSKGTEEVEMKPTESVLPEPVVPEEPVKPTEPVVPEEPVKPTEPVVPEEPVKPTEPVIPEPVVPEEPVKPTEPVIPEEPVKPTEPVVPEKPTEIIEPAPATSPAPPKHSGESCTFNKDIVADGQTVELDCVTCNCNNGALTCVKNMSCPGVCSVTAYQMIRTFDGTLYETPGTCSYVLVKTKDFTITLNNKPCSDVKDPEAVCIDSVDVHIPQKANIRLQSDGSILVAGEKSDIPFSVLDTITVLRSSSVFLDVVSQTFNLQYDFAGNRLYVILDASNKDTTSGLCGTYNDNRNDDYRSSSDMTETVSGLFSKSWKTQPQCAESQKSPENTDNKVEADLTCADSLDSSIFEDCALLIDTHSYKTSCAHSVYYAGSSGLCSALADYAYRCARAGITVSVSSTFSDCTPACEDKMIFTTDDTFSQQDCAEYSMKLQKITSSIPLNEACICPPNLYYDASINKCVNGDSCPCYSKNHVYQLGEIITQADGQTCPCERVLQCGEPEQPPAPDVQTCPKGEIYSDCLLGHGKSCEPSCQNLEILDQVCTSTCEPGCVCRTGMLRSSDGNCVPLNECPCVHGEDVYNPGETLAQDCNTCTCENGKFVCSNNPCNRVCNTYAGSQFFLFDGVWKTFPTRHCAILLVESVEGVSPSFSVVMQNTLNEEDGGALHKKIITIKFGGTAVLLSDSDPVVINDVGANSEFKTYRSGFYVVAHFLGGLAVYYDQHLDVIIQLEPKLQGKVQGMCGDADGTTTSEVEISNMAQYASRFIIGECPEDENPLPPPSENHKKFVENRCNLLKSSVFADCHYVVNVEPYFSACVEETEACREGESCLCYCTSLAAYARACCRKGVTVEWRGPDTCPSPCEYYNRDAGEGPYRLEMINGKSLVADYDNGAVALEEIKTPGNLQASFMVTKGLFVDPLNGRRLVSLESAQHHNFFIVQDNDGMLSLRKWQPSVEFRSQATFILRPSRLVKNYDALESYISRGNYLSLNNNRLVMSRVKSGSMLQMNFNLVEETFGLPSFSICTWKYRACGNPCIPTCQDPLGSKCTLTLKVEGCYPLCAPGMVFDEVTHRCVQFEDCINLPPVMPSRQPGTLPPHTPPPQTPHPETPQPETPQPETPPTQTPPPQTPPSQTPPPPTPPPQTPPPNTQPPPLPSTSKQICTECPPKPFCFMKDSELVVIREDPCCPEYDCECGPCSLPPDCGPNGLLSKSIDPETQCCFQYNCSGTNSKPTIPPPVPGTTPNNPIQTLPSPPPPCLGVLCPPVSCEKVDEIPVVVEPSSATRCCPVIECKCPKECTIPTCTNDRPPLLVGFPGLQCCPTLECPPPPTPPPPPCSRITCAPEPTCDKNEYKIQSVTDDPCCKTFLCIPQPTTSPTLPSVTPCETSGCPPADCKEGVQAVEIPNTENACCPSYICISTPVTTAALPSSASNCHGITCNVPVCLRKGEIKVQVPTSEPCCPAYECQCDPCPAAPYCGDSQPPDVSFTLDADCCPIYQCQPQTTLPSYTTTPILPSPPPPCLNVLCPPVTCTKMGAVPGVVEPSSDTRCCPVIECQCQEKCSIPTCDDNRPPLLLGDPETECCPEHQCPPPPTPPPPPCRHVTCAPEPTCGANEYKIQIPNEDHCCTSFLCIPLLTTPAPPIPVTPCESSGCPPADCKDGEKAVEMPSSENSCCPSYTCIPPPPPPTTPSVETTTRGPECHGITCNVPVCLRNGEREVQIPTSDTCCPAYECQCDPCPSAPYCGDMQLIVNFNLETECCPIYTCIPIPTTQQPPLPETTTPTLPTPPPPCLNVLCPPVTCTKMGAVPGVVEPSSATRCCPVIECQCQEECYIPTCDDNRPPLLLGDPATECCPEHQCPPPPTPPPPPCRHVTCAPEPTCGANEYKIQIPNEDHCCTSFLCIPLLTTPTPPASVTPCESSGCPPADCKDGEKALEMPSSENSCCPSYTCKPPPPPPTTSSVVSTTRGPECHGITCNVPVCLRNGERLVRVPTSDTCCLAFECQCDPCLPPPYCGDSQPIVIFNIDTECCPIYECPPTTTSQPLPTSTAPPTQPPLPTPLPPCLNVLCPPVTCTKMGAVPVVMEPSSATRCCPVIECQCQEGCYIPTCDDNRPPLLLGDPATECCPEHQCPPPPTPPPPSCRHVTCAPEPTCGENEYKIQSPTEDPCCKAVFCIPIQTTPAPPPSVTPCESSGCPPADCKDGEKALEMPSSENSCCPSYTCKPPPPPPTTPSVVSTTRGPECHGITCNVPVCLRKGEREVQIPTSDTCCPAYECQCDPCLPPPYCGDSQPIVIFNLDTECCPIYECPPQTTSQPLPTSTAPPTQPLIPTPLPPCLNVLCPPVTCTKMGAVPVVMEPSSATRCCPVIECQCQEGCYIPTCDDNRPPLLLGDPATECCPEHQCPPPPTPPPPPCRHVTCAPEPECKENEYKIQSPTDDPCCKAIFCIPIPTTPTPPTSVTPCESSGCPPADCKDGEKVVEMPSSENSCCPSYNCIPPSPPPTTPPVISTTRGLECQGITCNVPVCLRNGERAVQVPTSDICCPAYECQCDPCPSAPYCGDKQPIVKFNLEAECCPIYECPPTPTTPPPPTPPSTPEHTTPKTTVIISSTTHGCKDRTCPVKQCKDFETLDTHFNPKDPCCPHQTCECTCKTIPSCDSDERLVAVRQNNQCCPKLKCERKKDECHPVNTAVNLQSGHCSANVILATCSGYCHSRTDYNSLWAPVSQCRGCSVTSTRPKNFELSCHDGSKAHITVQEAYQCGCRHCSDDGGSGDGSGSGSEEDGSGFSLWSNFQEKN
ncbi:otogelin-like protein [Rana temporaria]|uniref:otogelin-like protein n=1 Tax=Rana temporaria TaxID=8407 RepID=UPI001AAD9498|nr:otogelin-like protein [Rana temporaria]